MGKLRTPPRLALWRRIVGWSWVPLCAVLLALGPSSGCWRSQADEKQDEQRLVRAKRLARERARLARNARTRRRNEKSRGRPAHRARPGPPRPCRPADELKRRVSSAHFNDRFAQAVRLVMQPVRADVVTLRGRPFQRFTFAVRMHPDDEPRFGRRHARPLLDLELRFVPLCAEASPKKPETLRVRLARTRGRKRGRWSTSLWPQTAQKRLPAVPVGKRLQLLLDPSNASLRSRKKRRDKDSAPILGVWEITRARFPDRHRFGRLSLPSSKLPRALSVLHAVEVRCRRKGAQRCRFLTRQQGLRSIPLTLKELRQLAAPYTSQGRILHLHAALLAVRFPKCGGDTRRATSKIAPHLCARGSANASHNACLFWRAQHGYSTPPRVHRTSSSWHVTHVLACPGKKLRVIQLDETYTSARKHTLRVSDLTRNIKAIDAELQRLTSRQRRQ